MDELPATAASLSADGAVPIVAGSRKRRASHQRVATDEMGSVTHGANGDVTVCFYGYHKTLKASKIDDAEVRTALADRWLGRFRQAWKDGVKISTKDSFLNPDEHDGTRRARIFQRIRREMQ